MTACSWLARAWPTSFTEMNLEHAKKVLTIPTVVLKIIPDVDGTIRIAELVRFEYSVTMKAAWTGLGGIDHMRHPEVGDLYLTRTQLHLAQSPGQHIITLHAPANSASTRALDQLRALLLHDSVSDR
jgi:MmyB-like transcription regulator ligand binding domain